MTVTATFKDVRRIEDDDPPSCDHVGHGVACDADAELTMTGDLPGGERELNYCTEHFKVPDDADLPTTVEHELP